MLVGIAFLCFLYAPLLTFLRAPPTKEEKKVGPGYDNQGMVSEVMKELPSSDAVVSQSEKPSSPQTASPENEIVTKL